MIKAPYNFVPLSQKVFFPDDWTIDNHQISHDIPFNNFLSGDIKVTITAITPIFIRNSYVFQDDYYEYKSKKISKEFCHYRGKFYIPGSSLKGKIRNILEIMSFSAISIEDKKYSYRDLNENIYKEKMIRKQNQIQAGWLYEENNNWYIIPLGQAKQYKKSYDELKKMFGDKIDFINHNNEETLPHKKYQLFNWDVDKLTFKKDDKNLEDNSLQNGIAVFVGKVNPRKDKEYFFPIPNKTEDDILLNEDDVKTFKEAYYIGKPNESEVWKYMWKDHLKKENGYVPIFYLKDNDTISFGLSMLFKMPYTYSSHKGIGEHINTDNKLDMANSIFGFIKNNFSLKSRVRFSHLKAISEIPKKLTEVEKILSSPKPSYYPMYVEPKDGEHQTMHNEDFKISGWKMYPVHDTENGDTKSRRNISTKFKPLPAKTQFEGKIYYHNLRDFELGAILSALTLHDNMDNLCHSLGMAKPYGYGKIKIKLDMDLSLYAQTLKAFEEKMEQFQEDWLQSEQIKELFAMSKEADDANLTYEDFNYYGNINELRETYSQQTNYTHNVKSFKNKKIQDIYKEKEKQRRDDIESEREAKQKKEEQRKQKQKQLKDSSKMFGSVYTQLTQKSKKKKR